MSMAGHWTEAWGLSAAGYEFDALEGCNDLPGAIIWTHYDLDYLPIGEFIRQQRGVDFLGDALVIKHRAFDWPDLVLIDGSIMRLEVTGMVPGGQRSCEDTGGLIDLPGGYFAVYNFEDLEGSTQSMSHVELNCPQLYETEVFRSWLSNHHAQGVATWHRDERNNGLPDDYSDVFMTVEVEKCALGDWHLTGCSCTLPQPVAHYLAYAIGSDHGAFCGVVRLTNLPE